jgi:hypothetical protein
MEAYVLCAEVNDGLRPSEATVTVNWFNGRPEFLRAYRSGLLEKEGRMYLAVGVVHVDPETKHHLIEFPEETDSGTK